MNTVAPQTTPTFESVWASIQEVAQMNKEVAQAQKETDKQIKELQKTVFGMTNYREESEKSRTDFDRRMTNYREESEKSRADFDRRMTNYREEAEKSRADFDRRMKKIQETVGGIGDNQGSFAEEYFFNSFENGKQNFFGEKFDKIKKRLTHFWQGVEDEYDIVLYNHAAVALIEVKYKAHLNDIPMVLKKAETFRILFPNYKDFKIYLGLASLSFYPELEEECINQGIAVIKQVGDAVIINDTNLKVF